MAELGVRIETERAVAEAMALGRDQGLFTNVRSILAIYEQGVELPLHVTVNQTRMQEYLLARVAEVEQPAIDAALTLNGTTLATAPSATGQQVLVGDTLQEITAAIQALDPQMIALRTRTLQPSLSDGAVQEAQATIDTLLATPLTLTVEGWATPFVWSREDIARLIRIERVNGAEGDTLVVSLDQELIKTALEEIGDTTEKVGRYPRVAWNGGALRITREGTSGERLDAVVAQEMVTSALFKADEQRNVNLPMRETAAPVTTANLGELGIRELLSVGRSDFSGSAAYRITNIQAGMRLLDGVLVAPDEEFSFNNTIGRIDASNGFVEGYAIVRNRTQLEWGGGICQDSTTMFRAAFWAGLPITERWGHSFYISWYDKYGFGEYGNGPGMDAAIFTGALDFKFINDTGNWILIQTNVDTSRSLAEVRIYGTDDGRKVRLAGPEITDRLPAPTEPVYVAVPEQPPGRMRQSDTARGGMTINFTRIIERDGETIERRTFETKFRPWPNIFEANPADLGPDGRPLPRETPTPEPEEVPPPPPGEEVPPPLEPAPEPAPEPPPAPEPAPEPPPAPEPTPLPEG
ncbi:MAG: vanomycin resistance protein VanB [Chloroflexia bacterium]|nr:vanomycin resistance protein VanB [Chloroflexia bacterium]